MYRYLPIFSPVGRLTLTGTTHTTISHTTNLIIAAF